MTIGIAALRPNFASVTVSPAKIYTRTSGVACSSRAPPTRGWRKELLTAADCRTYNTNCARSALYLDRVRYPETDLRLA